MKFERSNKFDFCYYGQVNSLRLKTSVASKWASKHLWGEHLFCWRFCAILYTNSTNVNICFNFIELLKNREDHTESIN